ncbi:helix-turn-helix domain-containing protein [Pseudoalteromonas sp. NGC95]|uniref:helix-turn-helix domain-containing protein n=1 Tax=Pseudoalteromonas sp. NGC95 TaxID=2792051 RepID=UPI0018CDBF3E|nr:helix-turn-helix transcriptional regulator [Pseudoalteromonas sp. NGC95]MBH0017905.1 helix-turn-helix transcriptional regulator [Pseudoalteromonas sp. NGC95]
MTTFNISLTPDAIIDSAIANKQIGAAIRGERKRMGLTRVKLTSDIGMSAIALEKYESGEYAILTQSLMQVSCAFGYTVYQSLYTLNVSLYPPHSMWRFQFTRSVD